MRHPHPIRPATFARHTAHLSEEEAAYIREELCRTPAEALRPRLLRLLAASEDARRACRTGDGAFVQALAASHALRGGCGLEKGVPVCTPRRAGPLRPLLRRLGRQRDETLGWLGFPAERSVLRVLRKLPPEECTPEVLWGLALAMRLPVLQKSLRHVPVVRAAHGLVLPSLLFYATPGLVHDLGQVAGLEAGQALAAAARGLLRDQMELEWETEGLQFKDVAGLQRLAEVLRRNRQMVEAALAAGSACVTVPLSAEESGFARPLETLASLQGEGREMRHCLGSPAHLREAAAGRFCAWSVRRPEGRWTVALSRGEAGNWCVHDVKGFANAEAPEWLHAWAESLVARADAGEVAFCGAHACGSGAAPGACPVCAASLCGGRALSRHGEPRPTFDMERKG